MMLADQIMVSRRHCFTPSTFGKISTVPYAKKVMILQKFMYVLNFKCTSSFNAFGGSDSALKTMIENARFGKGMVRFCCILVAYYHLRMSSQGCVGWESVGSYFTCIFPFCKT